MDTFGYIYQNTFDPFDLASDLIASDNDGCGDQQFRLCLFLQANTTYILVVTTNARRMTGAFSIDVVGGAEINITGINRIGECDCR